MVIEQVYILILLPINTVIDNVAKMVIEQVYILILLPIDLVLANVAKMVIEQVSCCQNIAKLSAVVKTNACIFGKSI